LTSDRQCAFLTSCGSNFYQTVAATSTSDRQCALLIACTSSQWQVIAATYTSNYVCQTITICTGGQYQVTPPTLISDRVCAATGSCSVNQYIFAFATFSTPTICYGLTVCQSGLQYESFAATATSDRRCTGYTICSASQYQYQAPTVVSDRGCAFLTVCGINQWQSVAATAFSDRGCSAYTICAGNQWQSVAPTLFSDRQCALITVCNINQWRSVAPTATSNAVCSALTICTAAQYQNSAPTTTSDRVCLFISTCSGNGYFVAAPATAFSDIVCLTCGCDSNARCIATGLVGAGISISVGSTCPDIGIAESSWTYNSAYRCSCNAGYAGNGFYCGADSDSDGVPNYALSPCSSTCVRCAVDICPFSAGLSRPYFIASRAGLTDAQNLAQHIVEWPYPAGNIEHDPIYTVSGNGLLYGQNLYQSEDGLPSAIIGDQILPGDMNYEVDITITQPPLNAKNPVVQSGFVGVVFGFNGVEDTWIAQWKRTDVSIHAYDNPSSWGSLSSGLPAYYFDENDGFVRGYARSGLNIKRVTGQVGPLALFSTLDIDQLYTNVVTTVYSDNQTRLSWTENTLYRMDVTYRPSLGFLQLRIFQYNAGYVSGRDNAFTNSFLIQDTGAIYPNVPFAASGKIGLYSLSQGGVSFDDIGFSCCSGWRDGNDVCQPYTICQPGQSVRVKPTATTNRVCG